MFRLVKHSWEPEDGERLQSYTWRESYSWQTYYNNAEKCLMMSDSEKNAVSRNAAGA